MSVTYRSTLPYIAKLFGRFNSNRLQIMWHIRYYGRCVDHIFVLMRKMSAFDAFSDIRKAFDCINRDLLLSIMLLYNMREDSEIQSTE